MDSNKDLSHLAELKHQEKQLRSLEEEKQVHAARKAERDSLTNGKQTKQTQKEPPPRILYHTDLEKICKRGLDVYKANVNKQLSEIEYRNLSPEDVLKAAKRDTKTGKLYLLESIELHLKLERFDMQGQELIDRFSFRPGHGPGEINPKKTFNAYQMAVFKELTLIEVDEDGSFIGYGVSSISRDVSMQSMYGLDNMNIVYHAFYPLITGKDTKEKALKELYQGMINTFFAWGITHQDVMSQQVTEKRVEEDRQKIDEKIKEFNDLVGFNPEEDE